MEFKFTEEEEKLRQEVTDFLSKEVSDEAVAEQQEFHRQFDQWGPLTSKIIRKMGLKGWLVPHWPKELGGLGMSNMANFIVHEEIAYFHLADVFMGSLWAGPVLIKYGSEELKEEFLLPLARGEIEMAVTYTEPEAGCDIANIQTRAVDKGDYFLVNGQKMFISAALHARYSFLGVRTDWENPKKHKGISILIVDLKSPGVTIRPMQTIGDWANAEIFFDDVKVPKKYLVGELNRGFSYIMAALEVERMFPIGRWRRIFDELITYVKEAKRDGEPLVQYPFVRQKLAHLASEVELARLLYYRIAYLLDKGVAPTYESTTEKLFLSELAQHLSNVGMQVLGLYGQLKRDSKWVPSSKWRHFSGMIENQYRATICETIAAGTSEIQRNIIAQRGLGLPSSY